MPDTAGGGASIFFKGTSHVASLDLHQKQLFITSLSCLQELFKKPYYALSTMTKYIFIQSFSLHNSSINHSLTCMKGHKTIKMLSKKKEKKIHTMLLLSNLNSISTKCIQSSQFNPKQLMSLLTKILCQMGANFTDMGQLPR